MATKTKPSSKKDQKSKHHHSHDKKHSNVTSTLSRQDDGTIQVTFTVPVETVSDEKLHVAHHKQATATVKGFRKGKAPLEKVLASMDEDELVSETVNHLVPTFFDHILTTHKIIPAIYPKIQVIKTPQEGDWQFMAITCELPEVALGDYKKKLQTQIKKSPLWKAEKGTEEKEETVSQAQKEDAILESLISLVEVNIPQIMVEEEVNARLTQLLERLEKLGITLEKYLESIKKEAKDLREDYVGQSTQALKLQIILNKIAEDEKLEATTKEIDDAITASAPNEAQAKAMKADRQQKAYVASVISRRKAIEHLIGLVS